MVKNSKKILVIHVSGRVGDTLLITPLLETISKHDYLISGKPINKIDILFKKIDKQDD